MLIASTTARIQIATDREIHSFTVDGWPGQSAVCLGTRKKPTTEAVGLMLVQVVLVLTGYPRRPASGWRSYTRLAARCAVGVSIEWAERWTPSCRCTTQTQGRLGHPRGLHLAGFSRKENAVAGRLSYSSRYGLRYCQMLTGRQKGLPSLALVSTFVRCAAEFDGSLAAASGRIGMIHR